MKPGFCFLSGGVGFFAVEVKPPNACSSQVLIDQSKLGLELKRMVDQQIIHGSTDPKSFGLLVEGKFHTFFYKNKCY